MTTFQHKTVFFLIIVFSLTMQKPLEVFHCNNEQGRLDRNVSINTEISHSSNYGLLLGDKEFLESPNNTKAKSKFMETAVGLCKGFTVSHHFQNLTGIGPHGQAKKEILYRKKTGEIAKKDLF